VLERAFELTLMIELFNTKEIVQSLRLFLPVQCISIEEFVLVLDALRGVPLADAAIQLMPDRGFSAFGLH
jgi:hypothetical protein